MKLRKILRLVILSIMAGVLLTGCGKKKEAGKQSGKPVIGVSLLTMTNPFFKDVANGIKSEADRYGYEVIITAGEFDVARQKNQISDFIVQKVAAIILCPTDSKSIATSIIEANKAGIPVFTADIACTATGVDIVSHIATNNYEIGQLAARVLIEAIDGHGKVGIIEHPEVESGLMRSNGFKTEIQAQNESDEVNIEIVSILPGGGAKDKSFKVAEDMLQAHADLNAIFAINDPMALGAVAAIEKSGKSGKIKVIGIDGQLEGRQAIREGKIYADVIQYPHKIGSKTVEIIAKYMAGEAVPSEVFVPTAIYRQQDALTDPILE